MITRFRICQHHRARRIDVDLGDERMEISACEPCAIDYHASAFRPARYELMPLAYSFPSFVEWVEKLPPLEGAHDVFDVAAREAQDMSGAARYIMSFLADVARCDQNAWPLFDVMRAFESWTEDDREAFLAWAKRPWWHLTNDDAEWTETEEAVAWSPT